MTDPIEVIGDVWDSASLSQSRKSFAADLLKALDAAGYAIVPKEPDDRINGAGQYASNHYPAVPPDYVCEPVHNFTVTQMYRAMIEAGAVKP